MKIYDWKEIEDEFNEGIIIGNGASIAFDNRFTYESLFNIAKEKGIITKSIEKIFNHFKTDDFELILKMLWHADHINQALGIQDPKTSAAYEELRKALIEAVRDTHVEHDKISIKLPSVAHFLRNFKTVVSLNYDFLVYWAILAGNNELNLKWFKDCFIEGKFETDWDWLRKPYGEAKGSTLVFYPHGNLILASDIFGAETKIVTDESDTLINKVVECWNSGKYSPIFVSEGTSSQKLQAINRSVYLKNVNEEVLKDLGSTIVIFGWSIGDQDKHILEGISKNTKLNKISVSVRAANDIDEKCKLIENKIRKIIPTKKLEIIFFSAESEGCWLN